MASEFCTDEMGALSPGFTQSGGPIAVFTGAACQWTQHIFSKAQIRWMILRHSLTFLYTNNHLQ